MPAARAVAMRARAVSSFGQLRVPCIFRCESCSGHPAPRATAIDSSIESSTRSSSFRICVAYGNRFAASGRQSAINSSGLAKAPGVYSSPVEAPQAPAATACSTMRTIRCSSAAVAGRSSSPTTAPRTLPRPIIAATFTAGRAASSAVAQAVKLRAPSP